MRKKYLQFCINVSEIEFFIQDNEDRVWNDKIAKNEKVNDIVYQKWENLD